MSNVVPKDQEYIVDDDVIIVQTDLQGVIEYGNRAFMKTSGYSKEEVLGKSLNIIRHPDMPKEIFKKLWSTIQGGQVWNGVIKNLRKDGLYYWLNTEILPAKDDKDGTIVGYIAVQKAASPKAIQENEKLYSKMQK